MAKQRWLSFSEWICLLIEKQLLLIYFFNAKRSQISRIFFTNFSTVYSFLFYLFFSTSQSPLIMSQRRFKEKALWISGRQWDNTLIIRNVGTWVGSNFIKEHLNKNFFIIDLKTTILYLVGKQPNSIVFHRWTVLWKKLCLGNFHLVLGPEKEKGKLLAVFLVGRVFVAKVLKGGHRLKISRAPVIYVSNDYPNLFCILTIYETITNVNKMYLA